MSYKIVNVSLEHQYALKRRMSAGIQMEPVIAGQRLLLRTSRILTDEQYEINKANLDKYVSHGVVTVTCLNKEVGTTVVPLQMPNPIKEQIDESKKAQAIEPPPPPVAATTPPSAPPKAATPPQQQKPNQGQQPRRDEKKGG